MIRVVADDTRLLKDLLLFTEPVEIYDTDGKMLGVFFPTNVALQSQPRIPFDPEEFKRRLTDGKPGATLREFWGWVREFEREREQRKAAGEPDFTTDDAVAYVRALREQHQHSQASTVGS